MKLPEDKMHVCLFVCLCVCVWPVRTGTWLVTQMLPVETWMLLANPSHTALKSGTDFSEYVLQVKELLGCYLV